MLSDNELRALIEGFLGDDLEAFDAVAWEMPRNCPEDCWRLLEVARRGGYSDEDLAVISAGPFEDLMGYHGADYIEKVEAAARIDERMRYLLGTVWRGKIVDAIWARLLSLRSELGIEQY